MGTPGIWGWQGDASSTMGSFRSCMEPTEERDLEHCYKQGHIDSLSPFKFILYHSLPQILDTELALIRVWLNIYPAGFQSNFAQLFFEFPVLSFWKWECSPHGMVFWGYVTYFWFIKGFTSKHLPQRSWAWTFEKCSNSWNFGFALFIIVHEIAVSH